MLGALDRSTSGKVFLDGIDIFSLNDTQLATVRNDKLGFIFQSYNLINRTTVLKNVEFPGIVGGMSDADRRRRALKLLDFLGKNKANFKPLNLSGGQQLAVKSPLGYFVMLTGPTVLPGGTSDGVTEPLGHNVSPIPCVVCVVTQKITSTKTGGIT
jgi:predicted ABC-type transport system involved in lysophospholipase L1 biosynthesis ATPase subunit